MLTQEPTRYENHWLLDCREWTHGRRPSPRLALVMAVPRKPADAADRDQADQPISKQTPSGAPREPGKTLQELERIQFDVLDRTGFDR